MPNTGLCYVISLTYVCRMSEENHMDPSPLGIDALMEKLHELKGEAYWKQLKAITERKEFKPVEKGIYSAAGTEGPDYPNLLDAAKKAVAQGYQAFILPNPKAFRSADLILERKGFYRMYDVKTISGKTSIDNRLLDSIGQSDRVLFLLTTDVNPRLFGANIKKYFEINPVAKEVLIFKNKETISITRQETAKKTFIRDFWKNLL